MLSNLFIKIGKKMSLKDLFAKKNKDEKTVNQISNNWYSDRYGSALFQRNFLFILLCIALIVIGCAVFQVGAIASQYTVRPFVIEVEETSGITNVVNPLSNKDILSNEILTRYFIMKYIRARESYCDTDYKFNYLTVVRLLSTGGVFYNFKKFVNFDPKSPILLYGKALCVNVKLRSFQFFSEPTDDPNKPKQTAVIRFTLIDNEGGKKVKLYRLASLEYKYSQMEMSMDDREVNPLGFQVVNYNVTDEIITNE